VSEPVEEFTPDQDSATVRRSDRPLEGAALRAAETPFLDSPAADASAVAADLAAAARLVREAKRLGALGIEGWEIGEEIGRGAQGTVYRAKRPFGQEVAIKVLRAEAGEPEIQRFEKAVETMELLRDVPGVVHVLVRGRTVLGSPFYAMDLVRGPSLRAVLDNGALDPRGLINIFVDVCYAVHGAHDRGIVHRDLKPENILLEFTPERLVPKIADFGLARDIYHGATIGATGTPVYMSPEQVTGGETTRRTDVHALGVILYEIVAGLPPYRDETLAILARRIAEERPRPPEVAWSGLPESLAEVILRALEKDPNARYPTAGALAIEIERSLRGETIGGVPIRPWKARGGRLRRLASRVAIAVALRRRFFEGALLGFLLGAAGGMIAKRSGWLGAPFDVPTWRW
jgi:serine/threonine protein kinase